MEKAFDVARRFRVFLFVLIIILWTIGAFAFWPPDMIPHPPILPENPQQPIQNKEFPEWTCH